MKKYEFTEESKIVDGKTLHRIKALKSFDDVTVDDLGGFVESERNLSHGGNCWVHNNACVFGNAQVLENAHISGEARIYDNAKVYGHARVFGRASIYDNAIVFDRVYISCNAKVHGSSCVYHNARIWNRADISDQVVVKGYANISGNIKATGLVEFFGTTRLNFDMGISNNNDIFSITNVGSENGTLTVARDSQTGEIYCNRGCFNGTLDEFIYAVSEKPSTDNTKIEYLKIIEFIKLKFNVK